MIEALTDRYTAHSSDDDDRLYREKGEVEEAKKKDAIVSFAAYLRNAGLYDEETEEALHKEVDKIVNEATDYAENAPYAAPEDALKYVYEEV
ncbi:3-methyl-2-oxobutanoate dehydrogenase (2-methylpropanoyl-transferring) [Lentibacillus sp. JNUCC-1]|nr:3-methyl-2-oxobutanoate dehydrogenase (2-methylpropanoyl-transferring) [Lentibacillus sp. JNUCC-1]